ncbi:MAG: type II toxin-antitoxin system VapC family toxin [Nitrospira sp.]
MSSVLDASAVIAVIRNEPGAERVREHLHSSLISCVNLSEVFYKTWDKGASREFVQWAVSNLPIKSIPFDDEQALISASIRTTTLSKGISFADRACLSLGLSKGLPVLTGDDRWRDLDIGADVRLFRERTAR